MLIDFETQKEELESYKENITKACDGLNEYTGEEWNAQLAKIQKDFMDFQNVFGDFSEQIPDLDQSVQSDAQKLYTKMNNDIHDIEVRINSFKKVGCPLPKQSEQNNNDNDKTPTYTLTSNNNLEQPLNQLEAGKETSETDQETNGASCHDIKKVLLIAAGIFFAFGIISLMIFIAC